LQSWLPTDEGSELGVFRVARFLVAEHRSSCRRALIPHDIIPSVRAMLAESMPER